MTDVGQLLRSVAPSGAVSYYDSMLAQQDPVTRGWMLMEPMHALLVVIAYLGGVWALRKWMATRDKPVNLGWYPLIHNGFLCLLSAFMAWRFIVTAYNSGYAFWCNGIEKDVELARPMARITWLFYFSKVPEMVDTFIMVLKKNDRQITFLHLYHHSSVFAFWWFLVFYYPTGELYFSAMQNCLVHVVMYFYYAISFLGYRPWWKRYITKMQLTQFVINLAETYYNMSYLLTTGKCPSGEPSYPREAQFGFLLYMLSMVALFGNFYIQAYLNKPAAGTAKKAN